MSLSDAQLRAHKKWRDKALKRITVAFPKDQAAALDQFIADHGGYSRAGFIMAAVREKIEREQGAQDQLVTLPVMPGTDEV